MLFIPQLIGAPTGNPVDWDGWEASLIESQRSKPKQKAPPIDFDAELSEDDQSKKKAKFAGEYRAQCMWVDGAESPEREMKHSCEVELHPEIKVLRYFSWLKEREDSCCERQELIINEAAVYAEWMGCLIQWVVLRANLPTDIYEKLEKDVSRSIAKVVLTIFDLEDFANIYVSQERLNSYLKLWERFKLPYEVDCFSDALRRGIKKTKDAVVDVAKESDKNRFAGLIEADVFHVLRFAVTCSKTTEYLKDRVFDVILPRHQDCDTGNLQQMAEKTMMQRIAEEMETYLPLEGSYKARLTMELAHQRCYYVLGCLFAEACKGFMTEELFKAVDDRFEATFRALFLSDLLVTPLWKGLWNLAEAKTQMVRYSLEVAMFALQRGPFGPFAKEVLDVIKAADYERRKRGHRFIGIDDILFGLSISRVRDHPLIESVAAGTSVMEPPEMPPYRIYKLATDCAVSFGSESVGLEHLVLAVNSVKNGEETPMWNLEDLRSLGEMKCPLADGWKEPGLLIHGSEEICGCESLVAAMKEGSIKVPEIRVDSS